MCLLALLPIQNASPEVLHLKVLILVDNLPHSLHGLDAVNHAHNAPPPFENQGEPHLYQHVLERLQALGAVILYTTQGSGIIAEVPEDQLDAISHYPGVFLVTSEPVPLDTLAGHSQSTIQAAQTWNQLLAGDADNDGMPDYWEDLYPCLDPFADDADEDPDGDHNPNIHEYYDRNNTYILEGETPLPTSNPCRKEPHGDQGLIPQCPGKCYFGDSDGDMVIGTPDLGTMNQELNGRNPSYAKVNPPYKDVFDFDNDSVVGTADKGALTIYLNGRRYPLWGLPFSLTVFSVLPGASVAVGDTVGITVELKSASGLGRPGFGVGFEVASGSASLWGGDCAVLLMGDTLCDETDGIRYDISGRISADGRARMVVKPEEQGTILVNVFVPAIPIMYIDDPISTQVQLYAYLDADGDGLPDDWENNPLYGCMQANTVDNLADYDSDTLNNETEYSLDSNPCNADTDGDTMPDGWENNYAACVNLLVGDSLLDGDTDSLSNKAESTLGSNPCNPDTDGDAMPDGWEAGYSACVNLLVGDSLADGDGDSLSNLTEYGLGSNPCNADTDGDGMPDGWELQYSSICGLNLLVNDAGEDPDGDLYTNLQEYQSGYDPCVFTDVTPPEITIVEPQDGMTLNTTITIHITYSDVGLGADTTTLVVYHNDVDITDSLSVGETSASGSVTGVYEGGNLIRASISDLSGLSAEDSALVLIESQQPPVVNIITPAEGETVWTNTPQIRIEYSDPGSSGVDVSSVVITIDDNPITDLCEVTATSAVCNLTAANALLNGPRLLEVTVKDFFNFAASAASNFYVEYFGPNPEILSLDPDFTVSGDTVTITGLNFANTVQVFFPGTLGPVAADSVWVQSAVEVVAKVPGSAVKGWLWMANIVGSRPSFVASDTIGFTYGLPYAYITNRGSHKVTVFDYRDNSIVTSLTIPGSSPTPYQADVTPDGNWLFIANRATSSVTVFNTLTNTKFRHFPLTCKSPSATNPESLVISPEGSRAFVGTNSRVISVIEIREVLGSATVEDGNTLCNLAKPGREPAVRNYSFSQGSSGFRDLDISMNGKHLLVATDSINANGRTLMIDSLRYEQNWVVVTHYTQGVKYYPDPSSLTNANVNPTGVAFLTQRIISDWSNPWRALIVNYGTTSDLDEDSVVLRVPILEHQSAIDVTRDGDPVRQNGVDVAVSPKGDRAVIGFYKSNNLGLVENPANSGEYVRSWTAYAGGGIPGIREAVWTPYRDKVLAALYSNLEAESKLMILDTTQIPAGYGGTIPTGAYTFVQGGNIWGPEGIGLWPLFNRDGEGNTVDTISDLIEAKNIQNIHWIFRPTEGDVDISQEVGAPNAGSLLNGVMLPEEGIGYRHYYNTDAVDYDDWGILRMIQIIEAVGREWNLRHPEGPRISIGDISKERGGDWHPDHDWHQNGLDADVRYVRSDGSEGSYNFNDENSPYPGFDQDKSEELLNLLCKAGARRIFVDSRSNLDDDPDPPGCDIEEKPNHHHHLHVCIINFRP